MNNLQSFRSEFCKYLSSNGRKTISSRAKIDTYSDLLFHCKRRIENEYFYYILNKKCGSYTPRLTEKEYLIGEFALNLASQTKNARNNINQ